MTFPYELEGETELYTEVGRVISTWSTVERAVCSVYCDCFDQSFGDAGRAAYQSFWSIISFEAKLKATDAAVRFRLGQIDSSDSEDALSKWAGLNQALVARNRVRNKIAHGAVSRTKIKKNGKFTDVAYLIPYAFGGYKFKSKNSIYPNGTMRLRDLIRTRKLWMKEREAVESFSFTLCDILRQQA